MDLTGDERTMLDLAGEHFRLPGEREQAIRDRLDMNSTRYHQLLARLVNRPGALAYAPVTVHRMQRLMEQRARGRRRTAA